MNLVQMTFTIYLLFSVLFVCGVKMTGKFMAERIRGGRLKAHRRLFRISEELKCSEIAKKRRREKIDKEIYEGISFLRNMIITGDDGKSSDFVIEQLSRAESVLQPIYIKMLTLLRVNKKSEAAEIFANEAGTQTGREFAGLLMQWDDTQPEKLSEILISHQRSIKERWITAQKKKDEAISDIIYLPVVVNVFIIFINFIYVGYFIQQQEMLQILF